MTGRIDLRIARLVLDKCRQSCSGFWPQVSDSGESGVRSEYPQVRLRRMSAALVLGYRLQLVAYVSERLPTVLEVDLRGVKTLCVY